MLTISLLNVVIAASSSVDLLNTEDIDMRSCAVFMFNL